MKFGVEVFHFYLDALLVFVVERDSNAVELMVPRIVFEFASVDFAIVTKFTWNVACVMDQSAFTPFLAFVLEEFVADFGLRWGVFRLALGFPFLLFGKSGFDGGVCVPAIVSKNAFFESFEVLANWWGYFCSVLHFFEVVPFELGKM